MTKEQASQLIERLGGINKNEHYCPDGECSIPCVYGEYELRIGDILQKIDDTLGGMNYYIGQTTYTEELVRRWSRCGQVNKSLQTILEESEWEEVLVKENTDKGTKCVGYEMRLKPPAKELFELLDQLFPNK